MSTTPSTSRGSTPTTRHMTTICYQPPLFNQGFDDTESQERLIRSIETFSLESDRDRDLNTMADLLATLLLPLPSPSSSPPPFDSSSTDNTVHPTPSSSYVFTPPFVHRTRHNTLDSGYTNISADDGGRPPPYSSKCFPSSSSFTPAASSFPPAATSSSPSSHFIYTPDHQHYSHQAAAYSYPDPDGNGNRDGREWDWRGSGGRTLALSSPEGLRAPQSSRDRGGASEVNAYSESAYQIDETEQDDDDDEMEEEDSSYYHPNHERTVSGTTRSYSEYYGNEGNNSTGVEFDYDMS